MCVYVYCVLQNVCVYMLTNYLLYLSKRNNMQSNFTKINIFCKPLKEVFVYSLTININTIIKKDFSQNTNL